jgi:Malectin domain
MSSSEQGMTHLYSTISFPAILRFLPVYCSFHPSRLTPLSHSLHHRSPFIAPSSLHLDSSESHAGKMKISLLLLSLAQLANAQLTSLDLINAGTEQRIATLTNNQVIVVDQIPGMATPNFNVNATFVSGSSTQSVVYGYGTNLTYRLDGVAPFSFCGNQGPLFNTCPQLGFGTHVVTATPFAAAGGSGPAGNALSVSFTIVKSAVPPTAPMKAPTKAPLLAPISPPVKAPTKAPINAPAKAPVKAATKAPLLLPTKAPSSPPVKAPTKAPLLVPTKAPIVPPLSNITPIRINCGSNVPYTDSIGRAWSADTFFTGGSAFASGIGQIANTTDDVIYRSERYGEATYNIPAAPGTYEVVLHFAEI